MEDEKNREFFMIANTMNGFLAVRILGHLQVYSMLLRKCRSVQLLIPNLPKHGADQDTYEGATVIEPKKAFYEEPIATLDFASLYPSIMQAGAGVTCSGGPI